MQDSKDMMREQLKKRFHTNQIEMKYVPKFPEGAEREYFAMMHDFTAKVIRDDLRAELPELIQILSQAEKAGYSPDNEFSRHTDAANDKKSRAEKRASIRRQNLAAQIAKIETWFDKLRRKLANGVSLFDARRQLNLIANANRKLTVKEWKKAINKTLGINLLDDYFDGRFYSDIIEKWISENVDLIVTIPSNMLDDMKKIVLDSYLKGEPVSLITQRIQTSYSTARSHSRLIARDQIGKLNSQITRHQQESCGVSKYVWCCVPDSRTRPGHRRLDKKVFSWSSPPVVDDKGRRCHPGEDYQCRCIAVGVIDFDDIDIPIDTSKS